MRRGTQFPRLAMRYLFTESSRDLRAEDTTTELGVGAAARKGYLAGHPRRREAPVSSSKQLGMLGSRLAAACEVICCVSNRL